MEKIYFESKNKGLKVKLPKNDAQFINGYYQAKDQKEVEYLLKHQSYGLRFTAKRLEVQTVAPLNRNQMIKDIEAQKEDNPIKPVKPKVEKPVKPKVDKQPIQIQSKPDPIQDKSDPTPIKKKRGRPKRS